MNKIKRLDAQGLIMDGCSKLLRPDTYVRYAQKYTHTRQYQAYWVILDDRHYKVS